MAWYSAEEITNAFIEDPCKSMELTNSLVGSRITAIRYEFSDTRNVLGPPSNPKHGFVVVHRP
jgi:hypothetical protein